MKQLDTPRFLLYALSQALRHPRKPIVYLYCPECRVRLHGNATECPTCSKKAKNSSEVLKHRHETAGNSPELRQESAIPWWGSVLVIMIGIVCWVVSGYFAIEGLDEAGRALIYVPLGSLFGMSIPR